MAAHFAQATSNASTAAAAAIDPAGIATQAAVKHPSSQSRDGSEPTSSTHGPAP